MKPWSFRKKFVFASILFLAGWFGYEAFKSYKRVSREAEDYTVSKNEILHLEINGVIFNGKKFLSNLKKFSKDKSIKAIVIEINSPGGAVGPSQELFREITRVKKETGLPVICSSTNLIASGGYYAALACDQLVVAPGTMIGSIGVIMEFANLSKLYEWAKISRYSIKSGKFKDSGAEYREMRDDEKKLFQDMIDEVYEQFAGQVATSRNLELDFVKQYADGRVMTGATAVKLKFADVEGTFQDAVDLAASTAKLGSDYKLYKPRKEKPGFFDLIMQEEDEDELNGLAEFQDVLSAKMKNSMSPSEMVKTILKTKFLNQPMYLMPGFWE